jgi:RNA binding chromodomain-containing protein/agenet domain-containing protein
MNRKWNMLFSLVSLWILFSAVPSYALICTPGDKAEVKWKGRWYPATVSQAVGNRCFIHYDGYANSWDEWVGPGRIRIISSSAPPPAAVVVGTPLYSVEEAVMVLWHGSWWPAHVLRAEANRWFIHYDNYGNNWDEWVGPGRIKKR